MRFRATGEDPNLYSRNGETDVQENGPMRRLSGLGLVGKAHLKIQQIDKKMEYEKKTAYQVQGEVGKSKVKPAKPSY